MIGILPAAGKAERIHGLPKYLLPVGETYLLRWHFHAMNQTPIKRVFVGCGENDELVAEYLPESYVYYAENRRTMNETLLTYRDEVEQDEHDILFGMPDTYWEADNVYGRLADSILHGAQIAVGVFRARYGQHRRAGMCEIQGDKVVSVVDKPNQTELVWLWGALAWQPEFWAYIKPNDPHVGYGLARAIGAGFEVRAVKMEGNYWDCGTPQSYFELIRSME